MRRLLQILHDEFRASMALAGLFVLFVYCYLLTSSYTRLSCSEALSSLIQFPTSSVAAQLPVEMNN